MVISPSIHSSALATDSYRSIRLTSPSMGQVTEYLCSYTPWRGSPENSRPPSSRHIAREDARRGFWIGGSVVSSRHSRCAWAAPPSLQFLLLPHCRTCAGVPSHRLRGAPPVPTPPPFQRSSRLLPACRPGRICQDADNTLAVEGAEGAEVMEARAEGVAVDKLAGGNCGDEAERVV